MGWDGMEARGKSGNCELAITIDLFTIGELV